MNLSLSQKEGVTVLTVTGPMDIRNLQILKAGITKLFKDGKNLIVLEVKSTEKLDPEVIKEIGVLDQFAKELSGAIAVACADAELKKSIAAGSIAVSESVDAAVEALSKGEAVPAAKLDPEAMAKAIEAKDREIEALKNQVKVLDPKEITKLRSESVELQTKIREMEEHVKQLMLERRVPPDADAYTTKINSLNDTIKELTEKMAAAAPKKG